MEPSQTSEESKSEFLNQIQDPATRPVIAAIFGQINGRPSGFSGFVFGWVSGPVQRNQRRIKFSLTMNLPRQRTALVFEVRCSPALFDQSCPDLKTSDLIGGYARHSGISRIDMVYLRKIEDGVMTPLDLFTMILDKWHGVQIGD